MNNFNKRIERDAKKIKRAFWIVYIINVLFSLVVLGGIGWIAFQVLIYIAGR